MIHRWHVEKPMRAARLRGARRRLRARGVPQPRRPAADGRALHAPRLRPPARARSRRPTQVQEGPRELLVKKQGIFTRYALENPAMDVVGWDGFVYPFAFAIEKYQPKTGHGAPAADHPRDVRGAGLPRLLVRAARGRHAPAGHPVPVPALERRLRRDHPLPARQLHEPARRRAGGDLAAPRGRRARAAPGRVRGEHRDEADRRAGGDVRHVRAARADGAGREHRGRRRTTTRGGRRTERARLRGAPRARASVPRRSARRRARARS